MLSWPPTVRIFLDAEPTDMRKGFDSLAHLVESALTLDPLSGHLFVFRSRRGDRIKILYWDRDGYAMWYKRLEKGSFRLLPFTGVVAVPVLRSERVRVHSSMKRPLTLHLAISGHHPLRAAWPAALVVDVVTGASPSGLPGPTGPCT
jgi:transposase